MKDFIRAESSKCSFCAHIFDDGFYCKAYPWGIPVDIIEGERVHNRVQEDQEGVRIFEEVKPYSS
jgi:hypothetical protein